MSKRTGQGRYQTLASDPGVGVGKEEGNPHSWRTSSQHTPRWTGTRMCLQYRPNGLSLALLQLMGGVSIRHTEGPRLRIDLMTFLLYYDAKAIRILWKLQFEF